MYFTYNKVTLFSHTGIEESRAAPSARYTGESTVQERAGRVQEDDAQTLQTGGRVCPSTTPREDSTC